MSIFVVTADTSTHREIRNNATCLVPSMGRVSVTDIRQVTVDITGVTVVGTCLMTDPGKILMSTTKIAIIAPNADIARFYCKRVGIKESELLYVNHANVLQGKPRIMQVLAIIGTSQRIIQEVLNMGFEVTNVAY